MAENDDIVIPGDRLGTTEEWMPGEGTYEDEGVVYSKSFGRVHYDEDKLEAIVKPLNPVVRVDVGNVVYGKVRDRRKSIVTVEIEIVEGESRGIEDYCEGTLHISKVSNDYIDDLENAFLKGDIIRAKVTQIEPSIQLTTQGKNYGVVRGYCFQCRKSMERQRNTLYCSYCERRESRKLSDLYGNIKLKSK